MQGASTRTFLQRVRTYSSDPSGCISVPSFPPHEMAAAKVFFPLLALLLTHIVAAAPQAQDHGHPDLHQQRRTVAPSPWTSGHASTTGHPSSVTTSPTFRTPILTIVTIRAMPIRITKQMQYVTSFKPLLTLCPLAGVPLPSQPGFPASSPLTAGANGAIASLLPLRGILRRIVDLAAEAVIPRQIANVSSCSVFWEPVPTPICHTTLSPLAAPLITVSECHQSVTFSSQLGYSLASTATAPPTVETLTTYYVAPWSDLSTGLVPTKSVVAEVCSSGRRECTTGKEKWDTQLSEYTQVTKTTVSVHTMVVGVSCAVHCALKVG